VVERDYTPPPVVVSRVQEIRGNPHGGPPGQLKKELGLKTGAEVVHGQAPVAVAPAAPVVMVPREGHGKGHEKHEIANPAPAPAPMISSAPPQASPAVVAPPAVAAPAKVPPGHAKGDDQGKGNPGKGNGKGHGKD